MDEFAAKCSILGWIWGCIFIIPALERLMQKDGEPRPVWVTHIARPCTLLQK